PTAESVDQTGLTEPSNYSAWTPLSASPDRATWESNPPQGSIHSHRWRGQLQRRLARRLDRRGGVDGSHGGHRSDGLVQPIKQSMRPHGAIKGGRGRTGAIGFGVVAVKTCLPLLALFSVKPQLP